MSRFFGADFTVTKRQLGGLLLAAGIVVVVATLAVEWANSEPDRFGTMQKMALLLGGLSMVMGTTLLPLGNRPA